MNTDFPLKAQDAIIGDVIIYPEMDMSRTAGVLFRAAKYERTKVTETTPLGLFPKFYQCLYDIAYRCNREIIRICTRKKELPFGGKNSEEF